MKRSASIIGISVACLVGLALTGYASFFCVSHLLSQKGAELGDDPKATAFANLQSQIQAYVKETGIGAYRCASNGESFNVDASIVKRQPDLRKAIDGALAAGVCQAVLVTGEQPLMTAASSR